ncbi:predicted protein [Streptomyces viridosporus ATCC 14672]|uniref:Predicted protein n=1 Tax=Streptomyces viridosporus (strain ATCC 14672 / DSM 40746 / JCM 4963 / KCTC 9882 / NRRL B-12104 / FH 1290) TaxID=566461 RepID=D6A026_STRV1|nr:predicted protein [Streptomyces viridosporus ATCC 14672]
MRAAQDAVGRPDMPGSACARPVERRLAPDSRVRPRQAEQPSGLHLGNSLPVRTGAVRRSGYSAVERDTCVIGSRRC